MSTYFPRPTVVTSGSSGSRAPVLAIWMWGPSMAAPSARKQTLRSSMRTRLRTNPTGRLREALGQPGQSRVALGVGIGMPRGAGQGATSRNSTPKYTSVRVVGRRAMAQQPSRGLADVVAAATALSDIDGTIGRLSYRGYDINQLAGAATFEEVAYLLQRGAPPSTDELAAYHDEIVAGRELGAL